MARFFVLLILFFSSNQSTWGQQAIDPELDEAIRGSTLSTRCQELIKKKNEKAKMLRRLNSLIRKVDSLLTQSSDQRQNATKKLEATKRKLKNEKELASMKVEEMEENIIRSGCPGIQL